MSRALKEEKFILYNYSFYNVTRWHALFTTTKLSLFSHANIGIKI